MHNWIFCRGNTLPHRIKQLKVISCFIGRGSALPQQKCLAMALLTGWGFELIEQLSSLSLSFSLTQVSKFSISKFYRKHNNIRATI